MTAVPISINKVRAIHAPEEITGLKGWLIWKFEQRPGEKKPRKVPYYPKGEKRKGVQNSPEDIAQLTDFYTAKAQAINRGFDGVGLALREEFDLLALDFDNCVGEQGVDPRVTDLVSGTYCEFSPSGNGIRALFHGGGFANRKSLGDGPFDVEFFNTKGFVTFTGQRLPVCAMVGDSIEPVSGAVRSLYAERFQKKSEASLPVVPRENLPLSERFALIDKCLAALDPDMSEPDWVNVGRAIHHFVGDDGFATFDIWSSQGGKYSDSEAVEAKWRRFNSENTSNPTTIGTLIHMAREAGASIDLSPPVTADEFQPIEDTPAEKAAKAAQARRFTPIPAHEFVRMRSGSRWLIKNVIPAADIVMVFGASGAGKTFVVIDLMMAVARGVPWRENRVKQGRVVYIAAEGAKGVMDRIDAYARHNNLDLSTIPVEFIADAPSFGPRSKDPKLVAEGIGKADLVVVDTLSRVSGGVSMNNDEMNTVIDACKHINRQTGAVVMVVHHSGKDAEKGAMGWSGIKGAMDAELEVVRDGDSRSLTTTKQKDGPEGVEFNFKLEPVLLGFDEDGDELTSCVVVETETAVSAKRKSKLGEIEKDVLDAIQKIHEPTEQGADRNMVIDLVAKNRALPPYRVERAIKRLEEKREIAIENVWLRVI